MVHIDDLCSAHIFLMEQKSVQGRYICSSINITLLQLADFLSKRYPHYNVPTQFEDAFTAPKVIFSSQKLVDCGFSFQCGMEEIYDDAIPYARTKGLL
eukprot:Gb_10030 [translate_table: standard]